MPVSKLINKFRISKETLQNTGLSDSETGWTASGYAIRYFEKRHYGGNALLSEKGVKSECRRQREMVADGSDDFEIIFRDETCFGRWWKRFP